MQYSRVDHYVKVIKFLIGIQEMNFGLLFGSFVDGVDVFQRMINNGKGKTKTGKKVELGRRPGGGRGSRHRHGQGQGAQEEEG